MKSLKQYLVEGNQRIVSFDDTIAKNVPKDPSDPEGYQIQVPNEKIINAIKGHIARGDKVILVTTRMDEYMQEVHEFLRQHNIPIAEEDVYNTNMNWKRRTLKRLGVDIHYDDYKEELKRIKNVPGIRGVLVKEEVSNSERSK